MVGHVGILVHNLPDKKDNPWQCFMIMVVLDIFVTFGEIMAALLGSAEK